MGQQQLILLVLATVIVGIAIVVGIRAFTENSAKSNADAMMQDAVRIANDAQAWKKKPVPFGGAGTADLSAATFGDLGYAVDDNDATPHVSAATEYENINGTYSLAASSTGLAITGTSYDDADAALNTVLVHVCGTTDEDIEGGITLLNSAANAAAAPTACP